MKKSWEKQQDGVIFKNVCNLGHPTVGPTASTDVHLLILATQNTHINVTKGNENRIRALFPYHREFQISRGVVSQTLIGISFSLPFLIL